MSNKKVLNIYLPMESLGNFLFLCISWRGNFFLLVNISAEMAVNGNAPVHDGNVDQYPVATSCSSFAEMHVFGHVLDCVDALVPMY